MIKRYALFAFALIAAVAVSTAMKEPLHRGSMGEDHSKLLKFSHTLHVKEQGVACEDCHTAVKVSKLSSDNLIPGHESCQSCHEEQFTEKKCEFCHTDPNNIVPFKRPKREMMFSHALHAVGKNIKCETCHAGLDTVAYASTKNMPSMMACTSCHSTEKVSTNCETCHTNFASLIPDNHLTGDFKKDHKKLTRLGMLDVSCSTCHEEKFCQDCHTGMELEGFTSSKDLMAEPSPRGSTKDSPKQLRLQQVHGLNYRFTHGIDVKSKAFDCSSCHEQESFCVKCHEAGGNITQLKFKPATHSQAGFTTIGKGSGGGLHAQLARRDLESCISCHDVQAEDPTCMMCHTETGVVR